MLGRCCMCTHSPDSSTFLHKITYIISAHLTVLLLSSPVLNLTFLLLLITSSHSHANASHSTFDYWRYINFSLTLTLTFTGRHLENMTSHQKSHSINRRILIWRTFLSNFTLVRFEMKKPYAFFEDGRPTKSTGRRKQQNKQQYGISSWSKNRNIFTKVIWQHATF